VPFTRGRRGKWDSISGRKSFLAEPHGMAPPREFGDSATQPTPGGGRRVSRPLRLGGPHGPISPFRQTDDYPHAETVTATGPTRLTYLNGPKSGRAGEGANQAGEAHWSPGVWLRFRGAPGAPAQVHPILPPAGLSVATQIVFGAPECHLGPSAAVCPSAGSVGGMERLIVGPGPRGATSAAAGRCLDHVSRPAARTIATMPTRASSASPLPPPDLGQHSIDTQRRG
jgi:hypothetical protein